jgi:hypothetical protein
MSGKIYITCYQVTHALCDLSKVHTCSNAILHDSLTLVFIYCEDTTTLATEQNCTMAEIIPFILLTNIWSSSSCISFNSYAVSTIQQSCTQLFNQELQAVVGQMTSHIFASNWFLVVTYTNFNTVIKSIFLSLTTNS